MTHHGSSGLYDTNFTHWLQKRFAYPRHVPGPQKVAAKRYARINVTPFLMAEFDPKTLARLNALGLAT